MSGSSDTAFTLRHFALAALVLLGVMPTWSGAQMVPGGANAPSVVQTQNGLEQVNINRPSGAGVSMNTYGQFDVPQRGAILNNSPTIVQTQQAGFINGNPNFGPGQAARVIVNQVNGGAASQINGHLEVAGQRAEVVIANGSGISVNGGGFINTSRAILTTGTPNFASDGSLSGFNVRGGDIFVQGAGLNASNIDQVDLISRAVKANAAIFAKNLNVVTGANVVDHDTLGTTRIAGEGDAPVTGVSIDVGYLGSMYAGRIFLVGTEKGVGVSTKGILAADAGDLILQADGKLVLAGQTSASGDIHASARDGIDNSGTTYAQQNVSMDTAGTLTNSGVLAAQQNTTVSAGSVTSTGTLGAGLNSDGTAAGTGDLSVNATGTLSNVGGTLSGTAVTVAASSIDNTTGEISGDTLSLSTTGALTNRGGKLTQHGTGDEAIHAGGTLDNSGGTIASNAANLRIAAGSVANDGGMLQHAGAGELTVNASGAMSNVSGAMQTNGTLAVSGANVNNTNGTLSAQRSAQVSGSTGIVNRSGTIYGGEALAVSTRGAIDNAGGAVQSAGNLDLSAGSALVNTQGTLSASGAHGALNVTAGDIDNTSGKLTNAGDGATNVNASSVTNTGGTLGGNGDVTVNTQTLTNDAGANFVAAGTANLNVTQTVNNTGGTLFGGTALNLNQAGANVINNAGTILGGVDVSLAVGALSNAGGSIRANRDVNAGGVMTGDGDMIAGHDLVLAANGDYTNGAANNLRADHDMTVSASGTLANTGTLAAGGALTASGANVTNAASGVINSSATTVNAAGALVNDGRIEGDAVRTHSTTLANTGTIIGNDVQLFSTDLMNAGENAVIAGAQFVGLYASNSVTNADGALIYSMGDLEIARDSTRDAGGLLASQTTTLTNRAADISADGNIDIAAHTLTNIRTGVVTQAGTPQTTATQTLTLWTAGIPIGDLLRTHSSSTFAQWSWTPDKAPLKGEMIGKLAVPVSVTVPKSQVSSLDTAAQTFSLTQPLIEVYSDVSKTTESCNDHGCQQKPVPQARDIATNPVQWYNSIADNGDSYTITFWPDFDPQKHIRPDQARVDETLGDDTHDYVETSRTVTTTTATDTLISAGRAATIQAQGAIRVNADGGSVSNESSTMASGGDLVRRANGGSVSDTGTVLRQTVTGEQASTFYWHQKTGGDSDTKTVNIAIAGSGATVDALPAIASSNATVQTDAATITIASVDRNGQTVTGSGVTGGSMDGTQPGGSVVPLQTLGGTTGGIPNLKLPAGGLYTYHPAPDATYLVVTDPRFTQYANFISSDYMLGQLGLDPMKTIKRLGDGMVEQMLVRNQITQLTGRTFLAGYTDNMAEYTALMTNGVAYGKEFALTPGIALSAAQMQQLTTDMVWLVSQDVTLPDGSHQTVLVPQVYLAQANTVDLAHSGALVSANAVKLAASGDLNNSGHIASDVATTVIGNTIVNRGVIGSAGTTVVAAVQDVRNTSGRIGGGEVLVQAGRDVINETQTYGISNTFESNGLTGRVTGTGIDAMGVISSTGNATVLAGRDVTLTGAAIQSGGNTAIAAGRDLNLNTTTLAGGHEVSSHGGLNGHRDQIQQQLGSAIVAGGDVTTVSGRDTTLSGSTVDSGGDTAMAAGRDLTVTASKDTHTYSGQSMGGKRAQHKSSSYDEAVNASSVSAGGNVILAAGQSGGGALSILGSNVATQAVSPESSGGSVTLISTGDITIGSVSETHDSQSWSHSNSSGFLSKQKVTDTTSSHQLIANGSTVSGDTVTALAGHDMTIAGSTVAATNDVNLAAANNLMVTTTQDSADSSHFHEDIRSGLGSSGGVGISYGTTDTKNTTHDRSLVQNGSLIGSTDGSVRLTAGSDLHVTSSDLVAAKDVAGTGSNVTIDAATGKAHHDETQEVSKSGFTLAVKAPVLDAISNTVDQARDASRSQDGRAAALHGMAAASGAYDSVRAAGGAMKSLASGQKPDAKIELSYGSSHSRSTSSEDSTTNRGTNVSAGGTAAFAATGSDVPGTGNVTIAGSNVSANDVILAAKNQVNLVNTTDTDTTRSSNQSSSASVGVSYGTQGFGISASMAKAHGDANSDLATQNSTHINAANTATIISGGDTSLIGANVNARQVSMDVGGKLTIASVQDTMTSHAQQESTGGGFSISQGGGSASFSHSSGKANGSYAGVNEQAGIQAGDGGFSITVAGNTDLKGGLIASDAEASKNSLSTATLTFSDIQNHSEYSAHSGGFSAGGTMGDGGGNYSTHGNTSGKSTGGAAPMLSQSESGSDSATTRSAISAGTISVTETANQKQDIASLSRDTSGTNGTVAKLPDLNNLLDQQADMMAAASAAGEAVSRRIGDFAQSKYDEAKAAGDQEGMNAWKEGGIARAEMQMAGAALVTGLAGGNALGGAAGAAIASLAAGKLNDMSSAIAGSHPTANPDLNEALGNIVANALATSAGGAIAGNAGSVSGYNVDRFNRQLHPDERQWISDNAGAYAKQQGLTVEQAITALTAQADRQVQNGSPGAWDQNASAFLGKSHGMLPAEDSSGPGYMFYATPDQKANANMYASYYPDGTGMNRPTAGDITNSVNRETAYRDAYAKVTLTAAGGAALITGGPAIVALPGAPIFSSGGALSSGALASPVGIGLISAGINAGSQYIQNGSVNPVDVAGAFGTGAAGLYGKLLRNVGINAFGSATTTALNNILNGKSDSIVGAGISGSAFSMIGYGAGAATANAINSIMRPTINNAGSWASNGMWSGSGYNLFNPNNTAVIGGGFAGGTLQEIMQSSANKIQQMEGKK